MEAGSQVLVHPKPRVRLLVRLFADAGLQRIEAVSARAKGIIDDSRVEALWSTVKEIRIESSH